MRERTLRVLLVLVVVGAAGCGGGDTGVEGSPTAPSPSPSPEETEGGSITLTDGQRANDYGTEEVGDGSIDVSVDNFFFSPTILVAPAGEEVAIDVVNDTGGLHNLSIPGQDLDVDIEPNQTTTVEVTFPDEGAVTFECKYHLPQDMRGELRVA